VVRMRAAGLLNKFQEGNTLMCLVTAAKVVEPLECLNRALQSKSATISSMLKAANHVKDQLLNLRTEEEFMKIMNAVEENNEHLELDSLKSPRRKKTPKRLTGPADAYNPPNVAQYFMVEFFQMLDVSIGQLASRLLESNGIQRYKELEMVLITAKVSDIVSGYAELCCSSSLEAELKMFSLLPAMCSAAENSTVNVTTCVEILQSMVPAMCEMFPSVESLVRLLLNNPASSATAERSFSSLRRLKSYIRSTLGQMRLNNVALCHVYKHILDKLDVKKLMQKFVLRKDNRRVLFGKFVSYYVQCPEHSA